MSEKLRQSTQVVVMLGPFLDATNGVTEETGLGGDGTEIDKAGAGYGTGPVLGTHDSEGEYPVTLTTTHTDTVGILKIKSYNAATHLPVWDKFQVITQAAYDATYGASAVGPLLADDDGTNLIEAGGDGDHLTAIDLPDQTFDLTGSITGSLSGSVGSVTGDIGGLAQNALDDMWDEPLTGASHNTATSSGRRLRQVEEAFVHANGVVATVTDGHTLTLDTGAVATADYYIGDRLQIVEGVGAGQSRLVKAYSVGRVALLDSDFVTNPDTSSLYEIVAADVHVSLSDADLASGFVATATSTTQVTLDTGAVATTDYYKNEMIVFTHGTGAGQAREITGYTSGRVVTMAPALTTAVGTDTVWHIAAAVSIAEIVDEVWDEAQTDHTTAGSMGEIAVETAALLIDVAAVPTVAEFNARTLVAAGYFDPAADTVGTVTTLTGHTAQTADHTSNIAAIKVITDALGSAAAAKLALSMPGTITGVAETGTLSTVAASTDLTGLTDDQLIGRVIVWTSGPADGEATDITDYAATNGVITFTALTLAPENGNTFIVI